MNASVPDFDALVEIYLLNADEKDRRALLQKLWDNGQIRRGFCAMTRGRLLMCPN